MYVQFNIKGKNFIKARIHCEMYLSDCFMKHNLMHISLHLIWFHEIRMTYVKRKPPRTFISKKCHIPMFATSPCCGNWLTCFPWKGYFHRRLFFFYRIQVILSNKKFPNWCTLQNIQIFHRTSQSTRQLIDSYLLTRKKKRVIFS